MRHRSSRSLVVMLVGALAACGDNNFPEPARSVETQAPARVKAGDAIAVTCLLTEVDLGTQEAITEIVDGEVEVTAEASVMRSGASIIARRVGSVEVACGVSAFGVVDDTPAVVEIVVGDPANIVTTITPDPVTAGGTATATCEVFDSSGNPITGVSPTLALSPSHAGNTITGLTAEMTRAGHYTASCTLPAATSNGAPFDVIPNLPASVVLGKSPDMPVYAVGDFIHITHLVADRYGNEITGTTVTKSSSALLGVGPIMTLPPDDFIYNGEGRYRVLGTVTGPTDGGAAVTGNIDITVNSLGPRITCNNDGAMVPLTPGQQVWITGEATDVVGVAQLTFDGNPVALGPDNTFGTWLPTRFGINFYDVSATDVLGATTTKTCMYLVSDRYTPQGSPLNDALTLKLTQDAVDDGDRTGSLDALGDMLHAVLNSQGLVTTLDGALTAANPLKPNSCDDTVCVPIAGCTCVARSEVIYNGLSLGSPHAASLTLVTGGVRANANVDDVSINLTIRGHFYGVPFDTTGWVDMDYLNVELILDTAISGNLPRLTVRPGSVDPEVGQIDPDFNGIDGWIINNVIAPLAQGAIRNLVENQITGYVTNNFNQVLDSVISGLDISTLGATFNVPRLDGSGNLALTFGIGFSTLSATTSRLLFGIGTHFSGPVLNPTSTFGAASPPGLVRLDPQVAMPSNTSVAAYVGILNQALHALWKANFFSVTLEAADISPSLPAETELIVNARLPPVATVLANGTVQLQLGAFDLAVSHPNLPQNLTATIGADAHASVTLVGNDLTFGGIVVDEVHISTDGLAMTPSQQAQLETLMTQLVQDLVDEALNDVLPALPIPSFPLPASLGQYGLPTTGRLGITAPALTVTPQHFTLRGAFGIQ